MRVSKLDVFDGFLPDLELTDLTDLGGLVRELAWLGRRSDGLRVELVDDVDSDGTWYGFPTPNS